MSDLARSIKQGWRATSARELALVAGALGIVWLVMRPTAATTTSSGTLTFLTTAEAKWVDYIHKNVVPRLEGSRAEAARAAAVVTWWALKEGVLDVSPNPWHHNLCSATGETQIGDLGVCTSGAWQIGMSGIQGNVVSLAQVEATSARIYPGKAIEDVLGDTVDDAGGVDTDTKNQIVASAGALRKAWLLRDPAISFTLQAPFVGPCLSPGAPSWCFGNWETARAYASSPERIDEVIGQLEARFNQSTGLSTPTKVLLAAGAAGVGYAWYRGMGPFRKT
jgi:hypothetical protein